MSVLNVDFTFIMLSCYRHNYCYLMYNGEEKSEYLLYVYVCVDSCAAAYVLLAEEEATTITEAERLFKKALTIGKMYFKLHFLPPCYQ